MATKLYMRDTANTASNMPTAEQSSALPVGTASHATFSKKTLSPNMNTVGNPTANVVNTHAADTAHRDGLMAMFISAALGGTNITAQTWTIAIGGSESNANVDGYHNWSLYVWRPSTQTVVGYIFDTHEGTSGGNRELPTGITGDVSTFSGSAVSGVASGDVLIFEWWHHWLQLMGTAYTSRIDYDGTADYVDNTLGNYGAYISTPQDGLFGAPPVSATMAATLGALSATATASAIKHPATLAAPLGTLSASVTAKVTVPATLTAPLGSLSATVTPIVRVPAAISAPLGPLTSFLTAGVTAPATLAAPLGSLAAAVSAATVVVPAAMSATLGGLTGGINATVSTPNVKYARTAGGNWNDPNTWSSSSGGPADTTIPTSADNVRLDANSGSVIVNVNSACRSLDCNGYPAGKTLSIAASVTLSIGDGTPGSGNRALRFSSTMTFTATNNSSTIAFVSTSTTQQTVDLQNKQTGNITFNGAGGSWQFVSQVNATVLGGTVTLVTGSLDFNNQTFGANILNMNGTATRTVSFTNSTITLNWAGTGAFQCDNATGLTVTANTATMNITGAGGGWSSAAINWNGLTLGFTGSGNMTLGATAASPTIKNLNVTGNAAKNYQLIVNNNVNIAAGGVITLLGNSIPNRIAFLGSQQLFARQFTFGAGCSVVATNVDIRDIVFAGTAPSLTYTSVADCQNTSGLGAVTTPVDRYWVGGTGNWDDTTHWASASGGAGGASMPIPHDRVFLDGNSGGGTITVNMKRPVKDLVCTGFTGTLAMSGVGSLIEMYGSVTLGSGMTVSGTPTVSYLGRGAHVITTNGVVITWPSSFVGGGSPNGYSLGDDYTCNFSGASAFAVQNLTQFTDNGHIINLTGANGTFVANTLVGVTLNMTGTLRLGATGAVTVFSLGTTGVTVNGSTWNIEVTTASANTRTLACNSKVLGNFTHNVAGSTGKIVLSASVSFNDINFSDVTNARVFEFTAAITLTVRGNWNVNGTAGKLMTLQSATAASPFILSKASGIASSQYLSIKDSTATGGAGWYAGRTSTNVSGNTGWNFVDVSIATFAAPLSSLTGAMTAQPKRPAVMAASLGSLTSSFTAVIKVPGTFSAPLGSLTGTLTAKVKVPGVFAAPLGSLTATITAVVKEPATLNAPLGALTATITAKVKIPATFAAPLGVLTASITAKIKVPATFAAPLGSLTGAMTGVIIPGSTTGVAFLNAPLGVLTATVSAKVIVRATLAAPLGPLVASAAAKVRVPAVFSAPLSVLNAQLTIRVQFFILLNAPMGELTAQAGGKLTSQASLYAALGVLLAVMEASGNIYYYGEKKVTAIMLNNQFVTVR